MSFDNVVSILSGGTSYYLSGTSVANYTGSGTPWTAESGSPYRLSLNDGSPIWVPQPAVLQTVFGGGPPFRNGSTPIYRSFANVTEAIGVQMYASSADNVVFLLRQLRQVLNTALYSTPALLVIQSGTNTGYAEIYAADVVETPSYLTHGNSSSHQIRATITIVRSPFFGPSSLTTLINGATFTNDGASNTASMGSITGDLLYEGSPLNISVAGPSADTGILYLAAISSRVKTSSGSATGTLTSTTPVEVFTGASVASMVTIRTNAAIKLRVGFRTSATSTPTKVQFQLEIDTSTSGQARAIQYSPWVTLTAAASTQWCDLGAFTLDALRAPNYSSLTLRYTLRARSSDGTSCSATVDYLETLLYYDFCKIQLSGGANASGSLTIEAVQAQNLNGTAWLPLSPPRAYLADSSVIPIAPALVRGTLPRAWSGASLWATWTTALGTHTSSATANITAKHAPQYLTLRGGA